MVAIIINRSRMYNWNGLLSWIRAIGIQQTGPSIVSPLY